MLQGKQLTINQQFEYIKNSYKLHPPANTWSAMAIQLKLDQQQPQQPSIELQNWSEETSLNPFPKTKLFKNKNSRSTSLLQRYLVNQELSSLQSIQQLPANQCQQTFCFQSFGKQENYFHPINCQYQSESNSDLAKAWNSESMQINFEKVKGNLDLPSPISHEEPTYDFNKNQNSSQSIKEFCFRLTEDSINVLEVTPIKKWADMKKKKQKIEDQQIKLQSQMKKQSIRKIIYDFLGKIDQLKPEELTQDLIEQTKVLLDSLTITPRKNISKKCQTKLFTEASERQTQRIYTQGDKLIEKCKDYQLKQNRSQPKIKVYECSNRKKTLNTGKEQKKTLFKEKRFRF